MTDTEAMVQEIRRRLESDPRIDFGRQAMNIVFANGELLLSGVVSDISIKRRAVQRASEMADVTTVRDELRLRPDEVLNASEMHDLLHRSMAEEPALGGCTLRDRVRGGFATKRIPEVEVGRIDVTIARGVVTLDGKVPSLAQKRLAGVLGWWVPGSTDVVNDLAVDPPEDDSDEALAGSLRFVLEKDSSVHAEGVRITARRGVVSLEGAVRNEAERAAVERDAWYLFGVDDVVNRLATPARSG